MICPSCGNENRKQAVFCMFCGHKMKESSSRGLELQVGASIETLKLGTLLGGRFQVLELINVGGMGYIYKGYDCLVKRNVAIKEMIDRFTNADERRDAIERFKREGDILCKLKHKAIPKFHEYFVENQRYYLVMDYVEGMDLKKIIDRLKASEKNLSIERIVQWALEICDVLSYLHSQTPPIVYRDLKPSNIIISPEGHATLIDFGIARNFLPRIKGTMVGTQGFSPPEQYRGEAEPRSDIYALGATLHYLLTNKDPQLEAPFHFEPVTRFNPDVPKMLEGIVEKALNLVPEDRYQTAKAFQHALANMVVQEDQFRGLAHEINSIKDEISSLKHKKTQILLPRSLDPTVKKERRGEMVPRQGLFWNTYRGDIFRSGRAGITARVSGRLKWRFNTRSKIESSPVFDDLSNVYFGSNDNFIYSIDNKGKLRWKFHTKDKVTATPVLDDERRVFCGSEDGNFYALNEEGMELWRFSAGVPIKSSALWIEKNLLFGAMDGNLYCLSVTGETIWKYNARSPIIGSCLMGQDGTTYLASQSGILIALKTDGSLRWATDMGTNILSTPALSGRGYLYVTGEDGFLYCVNLFGKTAWKFKTRGWLKSSPSLGKDGSVYIGGSDGLFYAVDTEGKEKWRFETEDAMLSSPAISDDGTIFLGVQDGFLYSLNPWGKSLWWFQLPDVILSSPAIAPDGDLYVGCNDGYLYSIR